MRSFIRLEKEDFMKVRLIVSVLLGILAFRVSGDSVGSAFSYSGFLTDKGSPASGSHDFRFQLFPAEGGASPIRDAVTNHSIAVSNGQFVAVIDFGDGVFDGSALWLQIGVRTNDSSAPFVDLSPRQPIRPVPYAMYATKAGAAVSGGSQTCQLTNSKVFESTESFVVPPGISRILVELWGGGGPGGVDNGSAGGAAKGGGGGGGGYGKELVSVNPGEECSITVGGAGEASMFICATRTIIATAGDRGGVPGGGKGGTSNALLNIQGGPGGQSFFAWISKDGSQQYIVGGSGGSSPNGGLGGVGYTTSGQPHPGSPGTRPGGGGGGGTSGAPGRVVLSY